MIKNNGRIRKGIIGWFALVVVFSLLVFPSYSDYIARSQVSEALSLASSWRGEVASFYEEYHRCPTNKEISDSSSGGRYVKLVQLRVLEGADNCYIVATLRQDGFVDRRIRGQSIVFVMEPSSLWQTKLNCETNLTSHLANCQLASLKE